MGKFILRENVHTYIDGIDYGPGDEVELDDKRGKELQEKGLVDPAGSAQKASDERAKAAADQSQAETEAEKAAAEANDRKLKAAEDARTAQNQPAPAAAKQPVAKK
jgi:predicted component of type VI protein secretion system